MFTRKILGLGFLVLALGLGLTGCASSGGDLHLKNAPVTYSNP
jgi:hypothetical protein